MSNQIKWSIDQAHSEIAFKIRHLMISNVRGGFKTFDANIYTTGKDFATAEIDIWIDAASITTGDIQRDEHLKSADFFDVTNHKQLRFTASTIETTGGESELWGELTMAGISKKIKLAVEFGGIVNDPWGKERAGFTVTGKINRKDWGLGYNSILESGGLMLGEEVSISCEVELVNGGYKNLKMELETAAEGAF